jgi:hypothetical protein
MNTRNKTARILVVVGALVLFASAALHTVAAYPRLSAALAASNLNSSLQSALRAVFLLVGWEWIVIAAVALLAAFNESKLRKILVLLCGVAVLIETAITLRFIGVFVGNEMIGSAAVLLIIAGLLFDSAQS